MKKKILAALLCGVLVLGLTGCGDKVEKATCNITQSGMDITMEMSATNDEIDKMKVTYVYDNDLFGVETLSTLTDEEKKAVEDSIMDTLKVDENTKGVSTDIKIEDQLTVVLDIDLTVAESDVLSSIGIDFAETDMSLANTIKETEDSGGSCTK